MKKRRLKVVILIIVALILFLACFYYNKVNDKNVIYYDLPINNPIMYAGNNISNNNLYTSDSNFYLNIKDQTNDDFYVNVDISNCLDTHFFINPLNSTIHQPMFI
ncbi:MAG: hypothetical protein K0R54_706 [Clostridiaceae bacterium]|jgi:flagellar basal body-associated protein FliL|nr:hypothetical protein [Clostridiaceae bacterium]